MAPEPQPYPGALAGAAAGPSGRAVETPYAAAAALSNAPGIGAGNRLAALRAIAGIAPRCNRLRASQTTPPHGAMQRGRRRRGKSGGPPPALPSRYVCRKAPFQHAKYANSSRGIEPFSYRPDKILPGTLHHSGIRPAPPSDHTPLARRSAFQPWPSGAARGNSNARAGLERLDSVDERAPTDVLIEVRAGYSRPSPRLRRRPAGARSSLIWLHFLVALVSTRNFKH